MASPPQPASRALFPANGFTNIHGYFPWGKMVSPTNARVSIFRVERNFNKNVSLSLPTFFSLLVFKKKPHGVCVYMYIPLLPCVREEKNVEKIFK